MVYRHAASNLLHHTHLPGPVPYQRAAVLQEFLVNKILASKRTPEAPKPPPYIITTQFSPVYTCGRREIGKVSPAQQEYLRADGRAEFVEAKRGGQTTFHGPGQLVAYPVIDLLRFGLTPRTYVEKLEKTLINTCTKYGVEAMTTENTGVWITPDDKIASIGLHMRRNVTSHGIGLNVYTDLSFFDRITACGLEGKRTTSFEKLGAELEEGVGGGVESVGRVFVSEFLRGLEMDGERVDVDIVERLSAEKIQELEGEANADESVSWAGRTVPSTPRGTS
jgi:lipoate-protein ligase B